MRHIVFLYLSIFLISSFSSMCLAQEEAKTTARIDESAIDKLFPSHNANLESIVREAERHIKRIDREKERIQSEKLAREHLNRANALYIDNKLEGAMTEWLSAIELTKDPIMKRTIRKNLRRVRFELRSTQK